MNRVPLEAGRVLLQLELVRVALDALARAVVEVARLRALEPDVPAIGLPLGHGALPLRTRSTTAGAPRSGGATRMGF